MYATTRGLGKIKNSLSCYSNLIHKSEELDVIRQKFGIENSCQDVIDVSEGKIVIKKTIPLGTRYGICHNYAFTNLMGIVGKASTVLNITGQLDYYARDCVDILNFFGPVHGAVQPGDIIIYVSNNIPTHTGIVTGHDCIESKWGVIRAVFEHPTWYVPADFGDQAYYLRPKINGHELRVAVQNRLKQESIKKRYDAEGRLEQQALYALIKDHQQFYRDDNRDKIDDSIHEIYTQLECRMNMHINVPDENGLTPYMHAEKIGCKKLQHLFAAYERVMNE